MQGSVSVVLAPAGIALAGVLFEHRIFVMVASGYSPVLLKIMFEFGGCVSSFVHLLTTNIFEGLALYYDVRQHSFQNAICEILSAVLTSARKIPKHLEKLQV